MKNYSKILALMLSVLMILSMGTFGVGATNDTEILPPTTTIYFEAPETWIDDTLVFCHIWVYGGDALAGWQSKKEKCTLVEGKLYSYDVNKVGGIEANVMYGVIFSSIEGGQTYDTLFDMSCLGDTIYCDTENLFEAPTDSTKTALGAYWRNKDATEYGPVKQFTSIGNLIGTCTPPGVTDKLLYRDFLMNYFENALKFADMTVEELLAATAEKLGLTEQEKTEVEIMTGIYGDEYMRGDSDFDFEITIKDATAVQKHLALIKQIEGVAQKAADADGDMEITIKDATAIQKALAKIDIEYPIGEIYNRWVAC